MITIALPYTTIALADGKVTARPRGNRHFRLPRGRPLREEKKLSVWDSLLLFDASDGLSARMRNLCEQFFWRRHYAATYSYAAASPEVQRRAYEQLMMVLRGLA